jgi:hypothetical protein
MLAAACNSLPSAKVGRIIPRAQAVKWVSGYQFFDFEQSQTISLVGWSSSTGRLEA